MNIYQPYLMSIKEITDETVDTRTFRLEFKDPEVAEKFTFNAGQFGEYSVFGEGESTFCIASPSTRKGYIECSFKASGKVTRALRRLSVGDTLGFRGPYGNNFPARRRHEGAQHALHRRRHRTGSGAQRHLDLPRPARPVQGCDHRLRRTLGWRPGVQARVGRVGQAFRHQPGSHGRSRWGNPRMEGPRSAYSHRGRRVRSEVRKTPLR